MNDEKTERSRRVAAIKETAKSTNGGRSYLLKGLWACRLAAGLDQRQLAEAMGSSQRTVGQLERAGGGLGIDRRRGEPDLRRWDLDQLPVGVGLHTEKGRPRIRLCPKCRLDFPGRSRNFPIRPTRTRFSAAT